MHQKNTAYITAAIAAAVLLLTAGQVLAAAPDDHRAPAAGGVTGTVVAVSSTTITLTNKANATFAVDASQASFSVMPAARPGAGGNAKSSLITIADIKAGDTITVRGEVNGSKVTAREIIKGQLPAGTAHAGVQTPERGGDLSNAPIFIAPMSRLNGTLTAVSGTALTLTGGDGAVYTLDAAKAVIASANRIKGKQPTISDLKTGDKVSIEIGSATAPLAAAFIMVLPAEAKMPADSFSGSGIVTALNGANFTLENRSGHNKTQDLSFTVATTDKTAFKKNGQPATAADLAVDLNVAIAGKLDPATATVAASTVNIRVATNRPTSAKNGATDQAKGAKTNGLWTKIKGFFQNLFSRFGKKK